MKLSPVRIPQRPKGLKFAIESLAEPRFKADPSTGIIEIFDVIGEGGTTPARISAALRDIGPKPVRVLLNSPGGDAFAGLTIFNLLRDHGDPVTTEILGIAASAASVIAMAGEKILMAKAAQMLIHRARALVGGVADELRQTAEVLDQVDRSTADLYAARTGVSRQQIAAMMVDETCMLADEAISMGFADALLPQDAQPAPKKAQALALNSPSDIENLLRKHGISRSKTARMTAAWSAGGNESDIDIEAVLSACMAHADDYRNIQLRNQ